MEKDIRKQLAERIRELRRKAGYTQQELAERSGLDYKHLQDLEGSNPPYARLDTLQKLADAFRLPLDLLLKF